MAESGRSPTSTVPRHGCLRRRGGGGGGGKEEPAEVGMLRDVVFDFEANGVGQGLQ